MTKAPTLTEKPIKKRDNTQTPPKTSITQRLRTDLGRSRIFAIDYDATSPSEIDAILACAEKRHSILRCPITAGVR